MGTPRVLFVEGDGPVPHPSPAVPRPRSAGDDRVNGVPLNGEIGNSPRTPWVMWRLLSGNNRELGRSSEAFPDLETAISSIVRVRSGLRHLEPKIVQELGPSSWTWQLLIDGTAVARSARAYQRLRECHYSVAGFTEALPLAAVLTDPSRVVHQRRLHAAAVEPYLAPVVEVR